MFLNNVFSRGVLGLFLFVCFSFGQKVDFVAENYQDYFNKPPTVFAPPTPYNAASPFTTDPGIFINPGYAHDLNLYAVKHAADFNNALAWQNFKNAWNNWITYGFLSCPSGKICNPPPNHPKYFTANQFEDYWKALTAQNGQVTFVSGVTPDQFGLMTSTLCFNCNPLDLTDLNLVAKTAPVTTPPAIGQEMGAGYFACVPTDNSPEGTHLGNSLGLFVKHYADNPFSPNGKSCMWFKLQ